MPTVADLLLALDKTYPFARAESWDKVGLQVGDRSATVKSIYVAYEVTDAALDAAAGHEAIVCYHPLLFRPLENLDFRNHTARLAGRILAAGQNLISIHTALDGAVPPHALGDALAREIGLSNISVLSPSGREKLVKISVFTPPEALDSVSTAAWSAGAGKIGLYDEASFRTRGTGTFRPMPGANPYSGTPGEREEADEWRLEVVAPESRWHDIVAAIKAAHPYEEVAFDVYPLLNAETNQSYGPARIGDVPEQDLADFATLVQNLLQPPSIRMVRGKTAISRVACSPGSGASFIDAAARAGADCLVTGDIKHHDALKAQALGLSVIDVTHAATERATIPLIGEALTAVEGIQITHGETDTNPFSLG
jgi:dinuclear metal center YbgI/SA1388 family protein